MTKPAGGETPSRTPRNNNNYALPNTPIASAKRPRSSIQGGGAHQTAATMGLPSTPMDLNNPSTPRAAVTTSTFDRAQLSPMHPARPLVIQEEIREEGGEVVEGGGQGTASKIVDAMFSPMLKFLAGHEGEDDEEGEEGRGELDREEEEDVETHDAKLSSASSQHKSVIHEDEEEDDEHPTEEDIAVDLAHQLDDEQEDAVLVEADEGSSQGSEEEEEEDEFNPYAFIKSLPSYENVKSLCPTAVLPAKDINAKPISLVLDLDETLVHCTVEACDNADLTFPVEFHGMTYQVYVRLRPHLTEFLEKICKKFEVIVFTASQQVYADALLDLIDPDHKYIKHRMFRDSCLSVEGNFLKDLNVLGRDLKKSVLVDNSPHAFGYQVDNGIPIESWFDDRSDTELLKLERFLTTLHGVEDVRTVVRQTFQTYKLIEQAPS